VVRSAEIKPHVPAICHREHSLIYLCTSCVPLTPHNWTSPKGSVLCGSRASFRAPLVPHTPPHNTPNKTFEPRRSTKLKKRHTPDDEKYKNHPDHSDLARDQSAPNICIVISHLLSRLRTGNARVRRLQYSTVQYPGRTTKQNKPTPIEIRALQTCTPPSATCALG
jgi:hypothetical protein